MHQLFPLMTDEVDPIEVYGRMPLPGPDRPAVRLNMIASADGAVAVDGRSGGLSGPADKALFATFRSLADAILVGATTVRAEGYGPVRLSPEARARRVQWGLAPVPPIAVLTRTCRLDLTAPFFTQAEQRPIVLTTAAAGAGDRERAAQVADVLVCGEDEVDPARALATLAGRGAENVLVEGGPTLNGELVAAGLVDELCLSLAPLLVGGGAARVTAGPETARPSGLDLSHVLEADGYLFLRYRRR
jgi:riboflavin-specific deaminase-like protein